jgi:hypothetical protein
MLEQLCTPNMRQEVKLGAPSVRSVFAAVRKWDPAQRKTLIEYELL